ncbi:hypothetical protein Tsubulata_036873 [Turnera subulata]|uniref:Uncharacterized protein n=1 Tax=Turnera subulata TaxID=218843 RepID=A0A9Q0IZ82_9ROSI|nr:hypothetical protein Tsubulata_036873 [Turnera subulata]
MTLASCKQWSTVARRHEGFSSFPFLPLTSLTTTTTRKRIAVLKLVRNSNKTANLYAAKKERVKLPAHENDYRISEFLNHPLGIQAMLNTSSLQSFQSLNANTYRCVLPKLRLLSFEAVPVLDLRVTPTDTDCTVEMLSCKFQGSEIVESQNDHFSGTKGSSNFKAFMINYMTWNTNDSDPFLEVDVKLNLTLEGRKHDLTYKNLAMGTSVHWGPSKAISSRKHGKRMMMQALVDRLVPVLVEQLMGDYTKWVSQQRFNV